MWKGHAHAAYIYPLAINGLGLGFMSQAYRSMLAYERGIWWAPYAVADGASSNPAKLNCELRLSEPDS